MRNIKKINVITTPRKCERYAPYFCFYLRNVAITGRYFSKNVTRLPEYYIHDAVGTPKNSNLPKYTKSFFLQAIT